MIKLTIEQLNMLNSELMTQLYTDQTRPFPPSDAFILADILNQTKQKLTTYNNSIRNIIKANGGKVDPETGEMIYSTEEAKQKAFKQIKELEQTQVEIASPKLIPKDSWPKLTALEACILQPLLGDAKNDRK